MRFGLATDPLAAGSRNGFTLLEILAAGAVFFLILALTLVMTSHLGRITSEGTASMAAFQEARTAFESMNRMLSQTVLNTYWDYDDPANPSQYVRASELHFVLGPAATITGLSDTAGTAVFGQAPLGLTEAADFKFQPSVLNALGFYVRFSESNDLPEFLAEKKPETGAWRLWMYQQPTENLGVYKLYNAAPQAASSLEWIQEDIGDPTRNHILANNVIFLLIRAGYVNASGNWQERYVYDSRGASATGSAPQAMEVHQLPPVLNVTLVAIDQRTADRLRAHSGGDAYDLLPAGLFTDPQAYQRDMESFSDHLDSRPLGGIPVSYRVFETALNLTSSKWSL